MPVLRYRAMVNRVMAAGLHARPYFHRYTDDAIDLCDVLGSFSGQAKAKLDEIAKVLGLAGKPEGVEGSQVETLVNEGRIEEVAQYCESDVLNTYRIWLIHELFRGAIQPQELEWSEAQIRTFISGRQTSNPHPTAAMGMPLEP